MTRITRMTVMCAAAIAVVAVQVQAGVLYFSQDSNSNGLYTLDTSTGLATHVGLLGGGTGTVGATVGLAPSDDPGLLYGSSPGDLLHINSDGSGSSSFSAQTSEGHAYDSSTSTLYGSRDGGFFTLDPNTGTTISPLAPPGGDAEGITFGRGGVFGLNGNGSNQDQLAFYEPGTNSWSVIGTVLVSGTAIGGDNWGLAYDPDLDVLYALGNFYTTGTAGSTGLLKIDPDTALATVIGLTGLEYTGGGLAYVIPEPATGALLALGLTGLAGRRSRQALYISSGCRKQALGGG